MTEARAMKYSNITLVIGTAVFSIGVVVALLFLGRKPAFAYPDLLPLTGLNALIWSVNAVRFIRGWRRALARHNLALAGGKLFSLSPKLMEVVGENQLWRRLPEHLRTEDKVPPHVAWELFNSPRQMGYTLSVPSQLAEAITGEIARQWPGMSVTEVERGER